MSIDDPTLFRDSKVKCCATVHYALRPYPPAMPLNNALDIAGSLHKVRRSIPIAFGEFIVITLRRESRYNPNGIWVRRHFPMPRHPLVLVAAPCPVACNPRITRTRLNHGNVCLECRWSFGHIGGGSRGRSRCHDDIARVAGGHGVRGGGGCRRCHRAGWRGWRRRINRMRVRCGGGATGQETERAATGDDGCVLP